MFSQRNGKTRNLLVLSNNFFIHRPNLSQLSTAQTFVTRNRFALISKKSKGTAGILIDRHLDLKTVDRGKNG